MKSYMNEVGTALFPGYRIFRKSSDIEAAKPSHLFLFLDVQSESISSPHSNYNLTFCDNLLPDFVALGTGPYGTGWFHEEKL